MGVKDFFSDLSIAIAAKTAKQPKDSDIGSLALLVQQHANKTPQRIALISEDEEITWQGLNDRANRVAKKLYDMGIREGDCVSLFMQNRIDFVACTLGINKIGAVAGMINTSLIKKPLIHCINLIKSKKCIFGEELLEPLSECIDELGLKYGEDYLFVKDSGKHDLPEWAADLDVRDTSVQACNPAKVNSITHGDLAMYVFTSGTTGLPKAAIVTNRRILSTGRLSAQYLAKLDANDRMYNCLPLFHGTGMVVGLSAAFMVGCSTVIRRRLSISAFWDDIRKYQCTSFVYVGEFIRYLLSAPESASDANNPIRSIVGNGLRPDIWPNFKTRFGIERIGEFYGGSEGNSGFANVFNRDCTVGCALSPVKLARYDVGADEIIHDAEGRCIEVKDGEPGLLLIEINDKARFEGYTNTDASDSKVIRNAFKEGDAYFNSGDLLKTIDVGFTLFQKHYQFVDRVGDTFRWKSENVSTNEVGDIISNYDDILFANVYGVEIPKTDGRAGMAAIVLNDGRDVEQLDIKALSDHICESLPAYARPIFIRILNELPSTATHKLQKGDLREHAYHLDKVADKLLVMKPSERCYTPLDQDFYDQIMQGTAAY
jgi:citronellyl-CoA synthetase